MWNAIEKKYQNVGFGYLYNSFLALSKLKPQDCKSVEEFNLKFMTYLSQMSQAKVDLPRPHIITLYLAALSDRRNILSGRHVSNHNSFQTTPNSLNWTY